MVQTFPPAPSDFGPKSCAWLLLISPSPCSLQIWFKNRRARSNQKKTGKLPGNPGYDCHNRLTSPQCGIPLVTYVSADTLYESSEQSKLQTSVTNVSLLRTTSLLHPPETVKQSSLQLHSAPERSQCPTVSLQPPLEPDLTVHAGHPTLSTGSDPSNHQMPSTSAVGSSPEVSQASMFPSNAYGFQQICPEAPRRQRKERTVYTKEQKGILQEHFEHCKHPSLEQRMELALKIGVTEYEIRVCLSLVPFLPRAKLQCNLYIHQNVPSLVIPQCLTQLGTVGEGGPVTSCEHAWLS